jgi:hypothetical protein
MFLRDDYNNAIVLFTNYKPSVIKKWLMIYKYSKHCRIDYEEPLVIESPNVDAIKEAASEFPGVKFPVAVKFTKEFKLDIIKFVNYLGKQGYDIVYKTKAEYEKDNPVKQPFIRPKRKKI